MMLMHLVVYNPTPPDKISELQMAYATYLSS